MALPSLLRVDLSRNFLNGPLSITAGKMTQLEEVRCIGFNKQEYIAQIDREGSVLCLLAEEHH